KFMNKLMQRGFLNALGTVAYVTLVATIMHSAQKIFRPEDTVFAPMAVLTLFVLSAAVTGGLVLGKPTLMYLNDQKKDAIKLFLYTIGWLAVATVIFVLANVKW